jgi:hypothetical protein
MIGARVSLLVLLLASSACTGGGVADASRKVPVLYCTDLFHPPDDPDDHFDLAVLYALEELDIRGIVLDQGSRQQEQPGRIPVEQMNRLTGREVPWAIGLARGLKRPEDPAEDQSEEFQGGVRLILDILEHSSDPVTIITVGSLRDVAAAFNRRPGLFGGKVARVMAFIGEASAATREWNVGLDPAAFIRIMDATPELWWVPCFDGGNFRNNGNASYWSADQSDLLSRASDRVMNFFIYALTAVDSPDPIGFLDSEVDGPARARVLAGKRNLWCSAVFTAVAGRRIVEREGMWLALPPDRIAAEDRVVEAFRFLPVALHVDGEARVVYGESERSRTVRRFQVVDPGSYARVMTSVTGRLIEDLSLLHGRRSYHVAFRTGIHPRGRACVVRLCR